MQFNQRLNEVNTTEHTSGVGMGMAHALCGLWPWWRASGRQLFKQVWV